MPKRSLQNYIGLTRLGRANNRYAILTAKGGQKTTTSTILNQFKEFLTNNIIGWFIHDWQVPGRYSYPEKFEDSIHDIATAGSPPVSIAVAADWATDTEQSQYIGDRIRDKNPDYTVHLGDTYFSGTGPEMAANFGEGKTGNGKTGEDNTVEGLWPRGKSGSFALCGNHEMFSSGASYFDMIKNPARHFGIYHPDTGRWSGQKAPCFCLRTDHWLILGLDTGYQSLKVGRFQLAPNNDQLELPATAYNWLKNEALASPKKRGIIVLTHHQYVTAFHQESEFTNPAKQLRTLLPDTPAVLWIWGHEHRFAMYGKNQLSQAHIPAYGRCIGNGGMPDEHTHCRYVVDKQAIARRLSLYDRRTADTIPDAGLFKTDVGFNGYAMIRINGTRAEITYYASYRKDNATDPGRDEAVFIETWESDAVTGLIMFQSASDLTAGNNVGDQLTYRPGMNASSVGQ